MLKKRQKNILCDKGYYNANNYLNGINKYKIIPLIFPKIKPNLNKLKDKIINLLDYFNTHNKVGLIYEKLRERLFELLLKWEDFRQNRWKIEKYFSFLKLNLKLDKIHIYTKHSIYKNAYLNVLLLRLLISHGQKEIK
ncbi:MAG: transposase [Methanobacteriaceae archaeon]|nr:transposase [Methanobacteriaceae archaeon]